MDHRGIPGVKPAVAHAAVGRVGIVVIAGHHDVAARDDLSGRLAVGRNIAALVVDDAQLTGGDQLDALTGLDLRARVAVAGGMLRARLANADRGSGFGEAVNLDDVPT